MHLSTFACLFLTSTLLFTNTAHGLKCVVTDPAKALQGVIQETNQECRKYLADLGQETAGDIVEAMNIMECYKIVAKGPNDKTAVVKGCIPKGGCNLVKSQFEQQNKIPASCYECDTDYCNSGKRIGTSVYGVGAMALFALIVMM